MQFSKDVFAANLRAERARRDLSQDELAAMSGVNAASIAAYENTLYVPGADKVCALAEALGCSIDALIGYSK